MASTDGQIKIRLVTRDEQFKVPDTALFVPLGLKRYGLSEVVNQLLGSDTPTPFEFMIDGQLLRSSLDAYLTSAGLSRETTLTLEYARSILPPTLLASFSQPDWISSVSISGDKILTGGYDGLSRIWNSSGEVSGEGAQHFGSVKSIKYASGSVYATGSMDRNVRLWHFDDTSSAKLGGILVGHTGSVDALAISGTSLVSASADTTLRLWSTDRKSMKVATSTSSHQSNGTASAKRRKLVEQQLSSAKQYESLSLLTGHTAPVTGVVFHSSDKQVIYSASQDHTVRTWDLATETLIDTKTTQFPLLSILSLNSLNLIACGSSARHIILHDPRAEAASNSGSQLVGHTNFVVSLASSPDNQYQLASGSHDGTVRVWDVRAQRALHVINRDSGENSSVFGVDWQKLGIVSVGKDKKVQINSSAGQS